MKITKANGKAEYALIENLKKRAGEADQKIVDIVSTIIRNVKENGDDAVREYTVRFDGGVPKKTVIEKDELQSYLDLVDDDFKSAIIKAKDNIYDFHNLDVLLLYQFPNHIFLIYQRLSLLHFSRL